jgi:hypothetical protein
MTIAMSENFGISKQRGFRLRCFLSKELPNLTPQFER